ncbi:hypothetical protein EJB05_46262, partial [Eragrostis curvula]
MAEPLIDAAFSFLPTAPEEGFRDAMLDYRDGLVLLGRFRAGETPGLHPPACYLVCNPATAQSATVPCSGWFPNGAQRTMVHRTYLLFDAAASPHRFHLLQFWEDDMDTVCAVHTFSSETNGWTNRVDEWLDGGWNDWGRRGMAPIQPGTGSAVADGALHLVVDTDGTEDDGPNNLVALDEAGSVLRTIPLPRRGGAATTATANKDWYSVFVARSQGRLHYVIHRHSRVPSDGNAGCEVLLYSYSSGIFPRKFDEDLATWSIGKLKPQLLDVDLDLFRTYTMPRQSKRRARVASSWPDLPPELLGVVISRLSSLADHTRLGAVCRAWRSGARLHPPPAPQPWLILRDGTFLDLAGYAVHRMPVPDGAICRGSVDDWLVLMGERSHRWYLMNPFSGDTLPLPEVTAFWRRVYAPAKRSIDVSVTKLAVSSVLGSSSGKNKKTPLLAAFVMDRTSFPIYYTVFVCRPGAGTSSPSAFEFNPDHIVSRIIYDIAFFKGTLYAVTYEGGLIAFQLHDPDRRSGPPEISGVKRVAHGPEDLNQFPNPFSDDTFKMLYLVSSGDRLLMVSRYLDATMSPGGDHCGQKTYGFRVFEATFDGKRFHQWEKVDSLHGCALFVGSHCSASVPANHDGVRENCVYYMHQTDNLRPHPENPLADSGVYDMRDGTCSRLGVTMECSDYSYKGFQSAARQYGGSWLPTWLFPPRTRQPNDGQAS